MILLVTFPEVKWPEIRVVPVAAATSSTACRPLFLGDVILTSARISMATVARAVSRSFSQVLFRFMR